jgi:hypothetical protein
MFLGLLDEKLRFLLSHRHRHRHLHQFLLPLRLEVLLLP